MVKVIEERKRAASLPPGERRSAIIAATVPLLLADGDMVTTRQIAEASGIAEGTIFRVFADKDAVIAAVLEAATDPGPMERALGALDETLPLERVLTEAIEILQRRTIELWRLVSSVGPRFRDQVKPLHESPALSAIFKAHREEIALDPRVAARHLRALTLASSHPLLVEVPTPPKKIVSLFLHGVARRSSC